MQKKDLKTPTILLNIEALKNNIINITNITNKIFKKYFCITFPPVPILN